MTDLIDNNDGTHTILVPIKIPNPALQLGGIELFVTPYGWKAMVGTENGEVPNTVTAIDFAVEVIQKFVKEGFTAEYHKKARELAEQQAQQQIDALLSTPTNES